MQHMFELEIKLFFISSWPRRHTKVKLSPETKKPTNKQQQKTSLLRPLKD